MNEDEKCTQATIGELNAPDKASLKHRREEEETLRTLGYEWVTDAQAWVPGDEWSNNYMPLLRNFEARALADSINDFIKGDNK